MSALFAFIHHLCFITIMLALFAEMLLLKQPLTLATARKIRTYDAVYGITAVFVVVIGSLRVMYFEKGPTYYMHSAPFMAKMALFIAVALISIYPTVTFLKWGKPLKQGTTPAVSNADACRLRLVIHLEASLLVLMILCAAMMAKGIGYSGS
jgi:putative membrane protein